MDIDARREAAKALRAIKRGGEGWFSLSEAVLGRPAPRDEVVARLADLIDPGDMSQSCRDTVARGIDSIYDWCFASIEGADGAEDELYCSIMSAIEDYRHPERVTARTARPVDRDALLALADEMDRSALELLKTNDLDPNRKRRATRRDHARSPMAASGRIREACGEEDA